MSGMSVYMLLRTRVVSLRRLPCSMSCLLGQQQSNHGTVGQAASSTHPRDAPDMLV